MPQAIFKYETRLLAWSEVASARVSQRGSMLKRHKLSLLVYKRPAQHTIRGSHAAVKLFFFGPLDLKKRKKFKHKLCLNLLSGLPFRANF